MINTTSEFPRFEQEIFRHTFLLLARNSHHVLEIARESEIYRMDGAIDRHASGSTAGDWHYYTDDTSGYPYWLVALYFGVDRFIFERP